MSIELRAPGERPGPVVFVETLLPPGVDAIRAGGVEYVAEVEAVDDMPEWADAVRLGGKVFVRKAL